MSSIAYLNGHFMRADQCKISALDRGFVFGDAIYEVIPAYKGRGFAVAEHIERLSDNLAKVNIANPYSDKGWRFLVEQLIEKSGGGDRSIYIQVTRGVAARDHVAPQPLKPTVFAIATPLEAAEEADLERGISAITVDDIRWARCDIKTTSLLANVLLRQRAHRQGAKEAIMIKGGFLTEGAASNVFVLAGNRLLTPPSDHNILPGITRDIIIRMANECGQTLQERAIPQSQLHQADEIWLSSSSRDILAVIQLDGKPVGSGAPGPLWKSFRERLRQLH